MGRNFIRRIQGSRSRIQGRPLAGWSWSKWRSLSPQWGRRVSTSLSCKWSAPGRWCGRCAARCWLSSTRLPPDWSPSWSAGRTRSSTADSPLSCRTRSPSLSSYLMSSWSCYSGNQNISIYRHEISSVKLYEMEKLTCNRPSTTLVFPFPFFPRIVVRTYHGKASISKN